MVSFFFFSFFADCPDKPHGVVGLQQPFPSETTHWGLRIEILIAQN